MTIKIEITDSPDVEALAVIHHNCFEKGWTASTVSELLAVNTTMAFVAEDGSGFGMLRHLGEEAELLTLAVRKEKRRYGIGKVIVQTMKQWAAERKAQVIFLEVSEHNAAACKLYKDNGFEIITRRAGYYQKANGFYEHALVMRALLK